MPGILFEPVETYHRMVNFERVRLGWTQKQIGEFASYTVGKRREDYKPADWMKLVYALRRCD